MITFLLFRPVWPRKVVGHPSLCDAKDSAITNEGDRRVELTECLAYLGDLLVIGLITPWDVPSREPIVYERLRVGW
jgi:hypothetical protein